jgi:hypothetical protein
MTQKRIAQAQERLLEIHAFSGHSYEAFRAMFFNHLKPGRASEALELILPVVWQQMEGPGGRYEHLLSIVGDEERAKLEVWLEAQIKRFSK